MKILIADDEHIICEWLKYCIEQNPDCELVGTAANGKEALEIYVEQQPDLVLTDIKMPILDGLGLLHEIRKINTETQVVILTAFSDFDLARKALRDGASEYLLKTEMQNQSFQKLLQRMITKCKAGSDVIDDRGTSSQSYAIIRNIMLQETELTDNDLESLNKCGVRWRNNGLFALAMWKQELVMGEIQFPKNECVRHIAGFDYTDRIYVLVGNLPRTLSESEKTHCLMEYANSLQRLNKCMVGVSAIADHLRKIPQTIRHAAFSLARGFYSEETRLYEPKLSLVQITKSITEWSNEFKALRNQLYKINSEQRITQIMRMLDKTNEHSAVDIELFTNLCCDLMDALYFYATENGERPQAPEECKHILRKSFSKSESFLAVLSYAQSCFVPEINIKKSKNKAVSITIDYLRKNFEKSISLEQVAEMVCLNPEYFSRLFKEETGISFIVFLTELRLVQSVDLLKHTALRVQDIAQQVGYYNASYFSTAFKKKYGISPFEYRRRSE